MLSKKHLLTISILGITGVIFGAFGAHALKKVLTAAQLQSYQTGVTYQFYHTLAILGVAVLQQSYQPKLATQKTNVSLFRPRNWMNGAIRFFFWGILLFSGSIYLLSCKEILGLGSFTKVLGPITPIGGFLFIFGWAFLGIAALAKEPD